MVAADRKIGGFNGTWGSGDAVDRKIKLLKGEGVLFEPDGRVSTTSLHTFGDAPINMEEHIEEAKPKKRKLDGESSSDANIEATIMEMVRARGAEKTC